MTTPKDSPVYEPLKLTLKSRIERGELVEGQQLPSEFELVNQFGFSRHQVRQALRELELEGYLTRAQGRGSFVAPRSTRSQGLRVTGSHTVAISYPQHASLYSRQIVDGFLQRVASGGYKTVAYNMLLDDHSEHEFLQTVQDSGVAGLAMWLIHTDDAARRLVSRLHESRFPIVLVDRYLPGIETDCVASNNEDIGYRLTRALVGAGHRRIAFATSQGQDYTSVKERHAGFQRALSQDGLLLDSLTLELTRTSEGHAEAIHEVMARFDRPTAFFCVNDRVMQILHERLTHLGYTVGENVLLASADDDRLYEGKGMRIVSVVQNAYTIGTRAAEFLMERIEQPDCPMQRDFIAAGPIQGLPNGDAAPGPQAFMKGGEKVRPVSAGL